MKKEIKDEDDHFSQPTIKRIRYDPSIRISSDSNIQMNPLESLFQSNESYHLSIGLDKSKVKNRRYFLLQL
jgi:hypothetical protein